MPELDERLPENPMVVEPLERAGTYGGSWRIGLDPPGRTIAYEPLVRWMPDWSDVIPNVAEDFEIRGDGTEYVFTLRPGMRWSDGEPFNADDIMFWYEDVILNTDLTPIPPSWMVHGDETGVVEKIDDHTVRFTFAIPHALFLDRLATGAMGSEQIANTPRHYLDQFHRDYADVEQLVEDEGFEDWSELFLSKNDTWVNLDKPVLHAWMMTSPYEDATRATAERNPYYWKTDPGGRQLPYIDTVVLRPNMEPDVLLLKATNGEMDFTYRDINSTKNKPVLARERDNAGYHFLDFLPDNMNFAVIDLNLAHPDATKQQIFGNKDFRIGLSHAINRQEIIDAVYQRQGEPWQAAPRPESDYYDEEFAKQYTEYDLDLANQHLDAAGFTDRDNEDFRLGPDGNRIAFNIEVVTELHPEWIDVLEMVRDYWLDVGIDMRPKTEDRSLFYERIEANQHDASIWEGGGGYRSLELDPRYYVPVNNNGSRYASAWAQWYNSGGENGLEPPETTRQQMDLYDQFRQEMNEDRRTEIMKQIIATAKDQFYAIGISLWVEHYGIVSDQLRNIPQDRMIEAWLHASPAPTNPEQYFIAEDGGSNQ